MKTVEVTLINHSGEIVTREVNTYGSAQKAAKALAYTLSGLTLVSWKIKLATK